MYQSSWTADGRFLQFSYMWGHPGSNGVWSWVPEDGSLSLIPAGDASPPSSGPEGYTVFSSDGYIFVGRMGRYPTILTDGSSPAWSPAP
jgi:hypothetical protein